MTNNLANILADHYHQSPDRVSIILHQNNQPDAELTYQDLFCGASAYASVFMEQGLLPGDVVILLLQHGKDLVFAFWGAILSGVIPSIMPFLTEKLLPDRYQADLASLISITQPSGIVTYPDFQDIVKGALREGDSVRTVILSTDISERPIRLAALNGIGRDPNEIVLLQHSSGTTGLQKGVALSHQSVMNQLRAYQESIYLSEKDVIISWLPLYHDMGLIAGFLQPILLGIPLVLMSPFEWVRAPYKLMQLVSKYHGTISWLPNFAYNFCAQKTRDRHLDGVDLSTWRAIINCSEPVRYESHVMFFERFKNHGLKFEALKTCYAMAENVFAVTQSDFNSDLVVDVIDRDAFQIDRVAKITTSTDAVNPQKMVLRMLSCGRPIPNTQVRIVDKDGAELPERGVGEIALRSDCMLTEYYKRPDETQKAFIDGWYLTGDYGYMAKGELFVSGRKKDLIIVGGKNIYPQDLERLAMEVDGVHAGRVVAFGIYNEEMGTEDIVIAAEVDVERETDFERIGDEIRNRIARGSAVSVSDVHLVKGQWLIKTSSGKIARLANRDKYLKETAVQVD